MTQYACTGAACAVTCTLIFVAWLLIASALLLGTWNKVIKALWNVKPAKYWQALLLIVTVVALCAPRYYAKLGRGGCHHGGYCGAKHSCCGEGKGGGDCPYHGGGSEEGKKK